MPGRTPQAALAEYLEPTRRALQCIAQGRFSLLERTERLLSGVTLAVTLNAMNSSPLKSRHGINLVAGQRLEIYETGSEFAQQRYAVRINAYVYGFTRPGQSGEEVEILHFHWDRVPSPGNPYPPGHLHIGQGLLAQPTFTRRGDFHHAHIPTGQVSIESVIRFAIVELDVAPLDQNWAVVLSESEAQTSLFRTR